MSLIDIETPRAAWVAAAACRGIDPDLFHPEVGQTYTAQRAKGVCSRCEVADQCLAFAIDQRIDSGIYGGLTIDERRPLWPKEPRPINHGTDGGYRAHLRRDEAPCEPCRIAANTARQRRKNAA